MERKQQSASSFADLFGAKHSPAADSSSSGIFSSLLASSDKAPGRWSQQLPETEEKKKRKKNGSVSQAQSSETGVLDNNFRRGQENSQIKNSPDNYRTTTLHPRMIRTQRSLSVQKQRNMATKASLQEETGGGVLFCTKTLHGCLLLHISSRELFSSLHEYIICLLGIKSSSYS